jgi:hypothetical protein
LPPWLFLAILVSLLVALGYQIILVRSLKRVPIYWAVVLAGFLVAEAGAESVRLNSPYLGELQVIPDLIGIAFGLLILRIARL